MLAVILGFLAVILTPTVRAWLEQRAEIDRVQQEVAQQRQEVAELEAQLEAWDDPAFVEQQARERLKFVRPGETSYTVLDDITEDSTAPVPGHAPLSEDIQQDRPWYGELWESVVVSNEGLTDSREAGTPQAPPGR